MFETFQKSSQSFSKVKEHAAKIYQNSVEDLLKTFLACK